MVWLKGPSLVFPSNFGMSEGSLVGIGGQTGSCKKGSLTIFDKSNRLNTSM